MTTAPPFPQFKWRKRQLAPAALERRVHIAVADLLRRAARPEWVWFHIPNGEYRTDATAALLQRMGVLAGVFDFLLIGPDGRHHWLELKRGVAPLSLAQLRFREELRSRNVPYTVARSFDEAVATLTGWNVLRPLEVQ